MDLVDIVRLVIGGAGTIATKVAEAALIARFPFLGFPIFKQIWIYFAEQYAGEVVKALKDQSTAIIIIVDKKEQGKDAAQAAIQLRLVQLDPTATEADKQRAYEDFKAKYAKLGRMRIATPT